MSKVSFRGKDRLDRKDHAQRFKGNENALFRGSGQ